MSFESAFFISAAPVRRNGLLHLLKSIDGLIKHVKFFFLFFFQRDSSMTEKIVKSLGLTIAPRDLKHKDTTILLQAIMSQWLPLSDAILGKT